MDEADRNKLEQLCENQHYQEIIDAVMDIPEEKRDYEELKPFLYEYLLRSGFPGCFEVKNFVSEHSECIVVPDWNLTITLQIGQISHRNIVLHLYLYSPYWENTLYECCAGMGNDLKQAVGMAVGSFIFSLVNGIQKMVEEEDAQPIESEFAGQPHHFQAYLSDIIGIGNSPHPQLTIYWDVLKEDIAKRLGNQSFCLIKIYGAKVNGEIIGECRINDQKSEELSKKIAELVKNWDDGQFASHKQFILIRQKKETLLPYPYAGSEGQERFRQAVIKAAVMFHQSDTQELYDTLEERLTEELDDPTLAQECCLFLPELCAMHAFKEIIYAETLEIKKGDALPITCYHAQLADFWPMWNVLFEAFQNGIFGKETDKLYQEYISVSSIYNVVCQIREKASTLSGSRLTSLTFQVDPDFEIR